MTSGDTARHWRRVQEVVGAALDRDPERRVAFLDEACAADPALRREVESLLAAYDRSGPLDELVADIAPLAARLRGPDPATLPRLVGRYRVLERVAGGGMGVVYRAEDGQLGRSVALKFLQPRLDAGDSAAERFRREARTVAALEHPNICTVHEIGETADGQLFIAMPLYEGETLQRRIAGGPLAVDEAVAIALQIVHGLAKAHGAGVVHRDVKPSNVFVTADGMVKLLDFGIAKLMGAALTTTGAGPLGTVAYMSPEQARGDAVDARSDLWSLGVVLYEMLAGRPPFAGDNSIVVLDAIQHERYAPLAEHRPDVPPAIVKIVDRALTRALDARYQSAQALERDLAALGVATDEPGHLMKRIVTSGRLAGGRRARAPRRVALAALAIVVLAVGVTMTFAALSRRGAAAVPVAAVPAPPGAARSLAVLPFVDLSAGPAERYFGDGLSEEITAALGRIEGLRVAARTSAFALRDRALDVRRIGDTLGVDAVLEGSVRRSGRRLRVTAQLVDAHTGWRIWAGEYDREVADAIAVQDEIARAIADALELRLPSRGAAAHVQRGTDLAAYDLYLRALQLRNDQSTDALQRATDLLERAIELQPDFALAHAAKASVILTRVFWRQMPRDEGVREARLAIDRAFALDGQLGEAHVALGMEQLFFEHDWAGAERSLRRAIALNPNDSEAWQHLANYLRATGRADDAAAARLRGLAVDPLNARMRLTLGEDYLSVGRQAEALATLERGAQLDPMHPLVLGLGPAAPLGPESVYLTQGREADAVRDLLRVAAVRGAGPGEVDALRAAFARGGMPGFWRRWLVMDRRQAGASISPLRVAILSAMAGDSAQALTFLERAYAERIPALIFLRSVRAFAGLRASPRYMRVEQGMKFQAR